MAQAMDVDAPYLEAHLRSVGILALRMSSRTRLGMYLNMEAIPLHDGLLPNYQGLAECIGFDFIEQQKFQRDRDPTQSLLMEWGNQPGLEPTLGKLVEYLQKLERVDILEDCIHIIRADAEHYLKKKAAGSSAINPVQDATVSQSPFNIDDMKVDETTIMTIQDVEAGGPTYYDAFVCYHPEGDDLRFVKTMIEKMECPPHNLKLFVPHRDDLPGASKHVISAKLIQDRCKRMVIVMSPRYLQSDACDFQTKFAHALSPGSRSKKLVPVLISYCDTPNILRHVTMCDYTRGDMTGWFWERLIKSLQAPLNPQDICIDNPSSLSSLEMSFEAQPAAFEASPSQSVTCPSPTSPQANSPGCPSPKLSSVSRSEFVASRPAQVNLPPQASMSRGEEGGRNSAPVAFWGKNGGGSPHPDAGVSIPLSTLSSSAVSPPSPSTERKGVPKKKDLKSKLKSVFSSHSSYQ